MQKIKFDKRIVIYGTGNTGKTFYRKYKDELNIYACTDSSSEVKPLDRLRAIVYEEVDKQKDFLVVCSIYYEEIRRKLLMDGLRPFVNFIRQDIFEQLYQCINDNKKLIVAIGQCEIREIGSVLSQISSFMTTFSLIYFDERKVCCHGDRFSLEEYYDCQDLLPLTDIFIQPIVFNQRSVEGFKSLTNQLKDNCKVLKIALFDFDSYWPQYSGGGYRRLTKYYLNRPNEKLSAYANRDQYVEKMVENNLSIMEISKRIKDLLFLDESTVIKNHNKNIKRAILTDRAADVKISDYIIDTYQKQRLYCERGHFSKILLKEYVNRILLKMDLKLGFEELEEVNVDGLFQYVNEFPVYPSTAIHLKLEWVNENTTYRMVTYEKVREVSFDQYMQELIMYYIKAKELLEIC